ncbi:hypothetical protein KS4_32350 [Poriferisphaera corsica]|uniref:Uncharacterized protein n=1 Tax=Poriferisphaera corsica TaxID=2528020 RepID=A0A517YY70_9BACT|nr:hypothetical protein KS4_32350 [Poriferisphaera corsica]
MRKLARYEHEVSPEKGVISGRDAGYPLFVMMRCCIQTVILGLKRQFCMMLRFNIIRKLMGWLEWIEVLY